MYFVKYGKEYLHDPRIQDCVIFEPNLECEKNTCGFFDFTIYPDNPLHDKLKERDSSNPIEVYDDDILLFSGFIYELGKEFYLSGQVKCKGELAYLKDSIVRPYSTIQRGYGTTVPSTVDGYFEWLIQQHNAQVDSTKQFEIGINQGSSLDKNNYIYRESNQYPNTLDELNEKILDSLGGYLRIRHENGKRYIDLLYECTDENTQILDFGVNLTDYNQTDSSLDVYTYVVPLGAKMKDTEYSYYNGYFVTKDTTVDPEKVYYEKRTDDEGYTYYSQCSNLKTFEKGVTYYEYDENYDESDLSLTIAAMEDGPTGIDDYKKVGDYIYCISAVNKYGFIGYTYEDQDVTTVENLVLYSIIDLRSRISPIRTIEIKAIDMHLVNPDIKPIRIGEYVRVRSVPHNLDSYFLCTSIELNLNNPENSLYTLGTTFDTLTGQQNKQIKLLNSSINQAYEQAEKLTEQQKKNAISAIDALNQSKAANDTAIEASTKVDEVNSKADEASTKADSANTKAEEAINNANAAADAAAAASNKADEATANVTLIQNRITTIEGNTEEAIANAAAAKEAADAAQANADAAATAASNAQSAADAAQNKADEAYTAADNVASQVSSINEEITGIKEDATALRDDLEGQIETVTNTMTADYAKKTDLSSVESSLKTEISTSAAGIKTEVSQTYATKTDLAATDSKADTAKNTADQAKASADANATDLANAIISFNSDVDSLQNQIDGSIQTWFYEVEPTDENAPAKDWTTTELKNIHLGDLYYDTITGYCYRYQVQNNQYSWQRITDVDVTKALADAAKAQETANNKRRVFVVTPTPPYDVGDLWVQGSTGDIMRCNIAKTNQQSYAESDWVKASKYTDDSAVTDLANTVETTYSTKSEVQQLSDQISSTVSSVEEVRVNAAAAQKTASDAASAASAAQSTADTAKANAAKAQSAADAAKANAAAAQKKADEAASNLSVAENNLADLQKQADATDEQLAAAQAAVTNAKKAADAAQADADAAATAASNAQSTADTAKANAATAQSTANSAKTAAEKAQSDVNSLTNRVTAAETKISQNSEAISLRATKTEVTKAIDSVQIGGRNLWLKTKDYDASAYSGWVDNNNGDRQQPTAPYTNVNGFGVQRIAFAWRDISQRVAIEPNTVYTLSAWIKWESTAAVMIFFTNVGSMSGTNISSQVGTDDYKRVSVTFNSGDATISTCRFECTSNAPYLIYGLKLEKGTKPTDWTPAPEDVEEDATDKADSALANAKSYTDAQIQVTSESITSTVSKTYATKTDLSTTNSNVTNAQNTANAAATAASNAQSTANTAKSTADSASKSASTANTAASNAQKTAETAKTNAATAQSTANSVKNDLAANYSTTTQMNSAIESVQTELTQTSEEIRMDFNKTVTTYVDGLQNQIDDNTSYAEKQFDTINKYIRFVDGKIILGEMGNELTLTIQNDRLSFMQSNVEVAYFSDNKLYINKAEVLTSLKIGKFEWVPGTDGSLSLRKRG